MKSKIKILLILLITLFSVSTIKNVRAEECENVKAYAMEDFYKNPDIYLNYTKDGQAKAYAYAVYTLTADSNKYVAFCRNAGACANSQSCSGSGSSGAAFVCKETVFDPTEEVKTDTQKAIKAYEKGVVEILKDGFKDGSYNYQDYVAASVALRTYEMLWTIVSTNGVYFESNANRGMQYYANKWLDDPEVQSYLNDITTLLGEGYVKSPDNKYTSPLTVTGFFTSSGADVTSAIESKTHTYIIKAFEASVEYLNNGAASITWNEKPEKSKAPVENVGGTKKYEVTFTHTFDIKNFKSDEASIKMEFNCPQCSQYGVQYKFKIDDQELSSLENVQILDYVEDGTGEVKLDIIMTATSDKYSCEEINYELLIKYFDDTISTEAYVMKDPSCANCQNFYMLYADDVEKEAKIEASVELCTLTCKEAEEQCNAGSQESCQIFNDKYGGDCAECTTYIANAECSESDSEIDLNEGYDVDTSNCGNISEDNLNVVQCIINSADPAGNSYKATTDEFTKVVSNQFCSVWCKEDYHFTLPGIKEVNSGRYFSLQASIEGQKSCYTSKIDEEDTFKTQADEARKAVIRAYNRYIFLYTMENTAFSDIQNITYNTYCTPCRPTGSHAQGNYCSCCAGCNCSTSTCVKAKKKLRYITYTDLGVAVTNTPIYTFGIVDSAGCGDTGNCIPYGTDYDSRDYPGQLETAITNLRAAIKAYADLVSEYDACYGENTYKFNIETLDEENTTGWKMEYIYDPTITFWYEESYMNSVLTDELETMGSVSVGGFEEEHFETDNGKIPINNVSEKFKDISTKLESGTNFVCYVSGAGFDCGEKPMKVGTGKYVKQKMDSAGSYITPTQFYTIYPTGAIVVAEAGREDEIENSDELTNMLPVGLGTRQGVYNYVLKAKDLGEYYNKKNELGRIWGEEDSVLVTVLEEAEGGNSCIQDGALASSVKVDKETIDDGVYVCAYKVNCPDCPVECDPSCKNPNCPDNDCPVECNNCIYTNNETNVNYRPITPSDINPNDRDLGVNWKWDENGISTTLELKAYATTVEIEEDGESIYDINYEDNNYINATDDFAMEITLDSNMISKIRAYNDLYEDYDGYANNTMKCYDYNYNGNTYKNIYCYSTFIDELLYDNSTKDNIKIVGNRIIGSDEESSDNLRKVQTQDSGYWTVWTDADSSNWTIATTQMIEYSKRYNENIGIGPSWK